MARSRDKYTDVRREGVCKDQRRREGGEWMMVVPAVCGPGWKKTKNKIKRNIQFHANLKNHDRSGIENIRFYTNVSQAQMI